MVGREEVGGKEEVGGREQVGGRGGRGSLWTRLKENEMQICHHLCCHSFCLVALSGIA